MNNPHYAVYTMQLVDALEIEPTLLDVFNFSKDPLHDQAFWNSQSEIFKNIFKSRYYNYELGLETIPLFKEAIQNIFITKETEYKERLNIWFQERNQLITKYAKLDITRNDKFTGKYDYTGNTSDTTIITDLPNKNTTKEYPSEKDNSTGTSGGSNNTNNTRITTDSHVNNRELLDIKREYMNLVRNIYLEFMEDYKTCFCLLWS